MKTKIIVLLTTLALSAALFAVASAATGAYFSDSKAGTVAGTIGTVQVETAGYNSDRSDAGGMNISFSNLLPGAPQTVLASYKNIGSATQDIWLVFPNVDALHALNDLGSYGSVSIKDSRSGLNWHSDNLTDFWPIGSPGNPGYGTVYPVPQQTLLCANVAPGESGVMSFEFAYAGKLNAGLYGSLGGGTFNMYPVAGDTHNNLKYVPVSAAVGSGLPYQIVATQPGQTPGPVAALPFVKN